jgi:chemotaxis response regulator CheB
MDGKMPNLVLAVGSRGGYEAFANILQYVDPDVCGQGFMYLAEHVTGPNIRENKEFEKAERIGFRLTKAEDGMKLEPGKCYHQPCVYENARQPILILGNGGNDGELCFRRTEPANRRFGGLSLSLHDALFGTGYANDPKRLMIAALSGCGADGHEVIEEIAAMMESGGDIPLIAIQDPQTAKFYGIPESMKEESERLSVPHRVLEPDEIGHAITMFFGSPRHG